MDGPGGEWQKRQNPAYVAKNAAKVADVTNLVNCGDMLPHGAEVAEVAKVAEVEEVAEVWQKWQKCGRMWLSLRGCVVLVRR